MYGVATSLACSMYGLALSNAMSMRGVAFSRACMTTGPAMPITGLAASLTFSIRLMVGALPVVRDGETLSWHCDLVAGSEWCRAGWRDHAVGGCHSAG